MSKGARVFALETALRRAMDQFEYYAREHRTKAANANTAEEAVASLKKVKTNEECAAMCKKALET
jgi:hypothetical protein